jgi:uncharacterized protein YjbI with pentapeptide repeats
MSEDSAPEVETRSKITPEEAQRRLLAGEALTDVSVDRLVVSGRTLERPITLTNCLIRFLDLNRCTFREDVVIRRCRIGAVVLNDVVFEKKADFKRTFVHRFRGPRAVFRGEATFASASMASASFFKARFEGKADFSRVTFTEDPNFEEVTFRGFATFWFARFAGSLSLKGSTAEQAIELRRIEVKDSLNLRETRLLAGLDLGEAAIARSVDFAEATLGGYVDFHRAQIGQNLTLRGARLEDGQGFRFFGLSAARIVLGRETVEGHVQHEMDGKYWFAAQEYAFLWSVFRQNSMFEEEDWAYYGFKRHERRGQPWTWNPLVALQRLLSYLLLDIGCGYGTAPFRTFGVCGAIVAIFAVVFYFVIPFDPAEADYHVGTLNHAAFALDMSVTAFSGSYADVPPQFGPHKFLGILEYLLGVVFIGLFVVAFSRKVIR